MSEINAELLKELLSYDPSNGLMMWIGVPDEDYFDGTLRPARALRLSFEKKKLLKPAFRVKAGNYYRGGFLNQEHLAHRVVWAIHNNGIDSSYQIDHINGNGFDNRLENIRLVSTKENAKNKSKPSNNTSGFIGVSFNKKDKTWDAYIKINRRRKYLGGYKDINKAIDARREAEKVLNFHNNHGRLLEKYEPI